MKKNTLNTCRLAIIKTLSYSGVFGYPITFYQITNNLISNRSVSSKQIRKELDWLVERKFVKKTKKRYVLPGIKYHDIDKRIKATSDTVNKNRLIMRSLSKIPWIKMIAITGSVANQNTEKDSDIDLLFITEKNRLWISRGFVFLILKIMGKLPKDQSKREICPNIFIDERNMAWQKKKRNLYIAQNIISMQPFIWRDDVYFQFLKANKWVQKYYGNFIFNSFESRRKSGSKTGVIIKFIELIARKAELAYMKKGRTEEIATDKLIHFNKNDNSKRVLSIYKKLLKKAKNS
jgi:hypothetical protein